MAWRFSLAQFSLFSFSEFKLMKAIIPTGGRGTRMQPITFSANKHFIPIANKPLIFYPIETIVDAGIKEIAITYNPGWLDKVQALLGNGKKWGANFTYVLQEEPKGLANIVEVCEKFVAGDAFVFHLGDNIFTEGIKEMVDYFQKNKPNGLLPMVHHSDNRRLGVPYFDKSNRLIKYVEKPPDPPHDFAVPGVYFADSNFFKSFNGKDKIKPSARGEYEIPAPFQWLVDHKYRVDVIEYKGKWLDPGKFDDWIETNEYILDNKLETKMESDTKETSIEGRVSIGKNCEIVNSKIRGPVIIGDGAKIIDSYVGPYSSISNNCEILGSHVENSVIMEGVKILNVERPIDTSLIGTQAEIIKKVGPSNSLKLFIGEKSQIEI